MKSTARRVTLCILLALLGPHGIQAQQDLQVPFDKALCGDDDSTEAKCVLEAEHPPEPGIYDTSRAVARLLIEGNVACTGWLVGSEGHVLTNAHCIRDQSDADLTRFEFMAEGPDCDTDCAFVPDEFPPLACAGPVEAISGAVVRVNPDLDYALVLPDTSTGSNTDLASTYGFLRLRCDGAQMDERIFIPQHPQGWGKRVAVKSTHLADTSGLAVITSLDEPGCVTVGPPRPVDVTINEVGYYADSQTGASGSPVIGYGDHRVVALHNCGPEPQGMACTQSGGDPNRGIPIEAIIADLGHLIPNHAVLDNDHFETSISISGFFGSAAGLTNCATTEPLEPAHAGATGTGSIWWTWTAPTSGDVEFGTTGSTFDTVLAVYTGTELDNLLEFAAADTPGGPDSVVVTVVDGETYHIAVDGKTDQGDVTLNWNMLSGFADLSVTLTDLTDPIEVTDSLTYVAQVSNAGPNDATNVSLAYAVPVELTYLDDLADTCTESVGIVTCTLGTIPAGQSTVVLLDTTAQQAAVVTSAVLVSATEPDPDLLNGDSQITTVGDPALAFETKLTASDAAAEDEFGSSIAISGNTLIVGAAEDVLPGPNSPGAAYVFEKIGGVWTEQKKLVPSDGSIGDYFGVSVAIDGDVAVIGSYRHGGSPGVDSGAAYVFERNEGGIANWGEVIKLLGDDSQAGDLFGLNVAARGDIIAVGAHRGDGAVPDSGAAYIFQKSGGLWSEQMKLSPSELQTNDGFGRSISINNDKIVVGVTKGDGVAVDTGTSYVFRDNGGIWMQEAKLNIGDGQELDGFGRFVVLEGDTVVVGATQGDGSVVDSGEVYLFGYNGVSWKLDAELMADDPGFHDLFGSAIGISANRMAVGSPFDDDHGFSSGAVYLYRQAEGGWAQEDKITANDGAKGDVFGGHLVLVEDSLIVTANGDDDMGVDSGSVYIYNLLSSSNLTTISQTNPVTAITVNPGDQVALTWTSTNTDPGDLITLSMRRDSDPTSDMVLVADSLNDGAETVIVPMDAVEAADWRFTVRHAGSGALDSSPVPFTIQAPPTDLALFVTAPGTVIVGSDVTHTITVTNNGPEDAEDVIISTTLAGNFTISSVIPAESCGENGGSVSCQFDTLSNGASIEVAITVTAHQPSVITSDTSVGAAGGDQDTGNNTATVSTTVVDPSALIFIDGFESGTIAAWSGSVP